MKYCVLPGANAQRAIERVNVGLIGCGGRGIQVAKAIGSQDDAAVRYVCDPDSRRAAKAREATGADHAVSDLRRILAERNELYSKAHASIDTNDKSIEDCVAELIRIAPQGLKNDMSAALDA